MKYNGHKNYNAWNISLWINNDEPLYRWAQQLIRHYGNKDSAASVMADTLEGQKTPDGVPYTRTNIRAALVGI